MAFVELKDVRKTYRMGDVVIHASDGISFSVERGEFVVVAGPSGAGKTTVLNILGGMDGCDGGAVMVDGQDISKYNEKQLTTYRRNDIGFVFQFYNLVQNLTAKENVELALQICKNPLSADEVLSEVGLSNRMGNFLLCDEPTGALDYNTGKQILKLLQDTCRQKGMTVIVITHNSAIAPMADTVIRIKNGKVGEIEKNEKPVDVMGIEW